MQKQLNDAGQMLKQLLRYYYHHIPENLRLGAAYRQQRAFLSQSRRWTKDEVATWQSKRLKDVVIEALSSSPYYQQVFAAKGLCPREIDSVRDLPRLPILTKHEIQTNIEAIRSQRFPKNSLTYGTTSGSTGIPLGIYALKSFAKDVEKAFVHDIWSRLGYGTHGGKHLHMRGYVIKDELCQRFGRDLLLSTYQMTNDNLPQYVDIVQRFKPDFIQAYPSSISLLCSHMHDTGAGRIPNLKLVMCSSEVLLPQQQELIQRTLGVPVCNLYGNTEHSVIAGNCPYSDMLHVYPQYGILELINEQGQACTEDGEVGEIVTTTLTNPAFPLFRYATGDMAVLSTRTCKCAWNHVLLREVQGRKQECVVSRVGRRVGIAALNSHSEIYRRVREFQFYQDTPGVVILKIIPRNGFGEVDEVNIRTELMSKLGEGMELQLRVVPELKRGSRGKHLFIEQRLAPTC